MKLIIWAEQVQDHLKWKDIVQMPRLYQSCSAEEEESGLLTSDLSSHDFCPHRKMLIFHDLYELGAKMIL